MSAFMAIIADTWRQSKQQWVFFLMAGVLLLTAVFFIAAGKVKTTPDGDKVFDIAFGSETPSAGLEVRWDGKYRELVHEELQHTKAKIKARESAMVSESKARTAARDYKRLTDNGASKAELDAAELRFKTVEKEARDQANAFKALQTRQIAEAQTLVDERAKDMTPLRKGVEYWLHWAAWALFTFSMWLFIAACGGYYPGTLTSGAVDVLISKPITRAQLFFGKFLGGLVLYAILITAVYLILFVGVGVRSGVWHFRFFAGIPLTVFSAALLFAIVGWIGVFTRSTAFSIVIGYGFYIIIDTVIGWVQALRNVPVGEDFGSTFEVLKTVGETASFIFPGFDRLKEATEAATLNVPILEAQPVIVACVWLGVCLGTAYWRFDRLDF